MISAGSIVRQIMQDIGETNLDTYLPMVQKAVSKAYKTVCGEHMWSFTIRSFEPSSTAVATQPVVLPSDLKRIKAVRDDNYVYYQDFSDGKAPKHNYNWFFDTDVSTELSSGLAGDSTGASATVNSTKVTFKSGVTLPTSIVGEYIRIGEAEDSYEIAARVSATELTLSRRFRHWDDTQKKVAWKIRPMHTKRMKFINSESESVTPSNLVVKYSAEPLILTSMSDEVPVPNDADAVYILGLQLSMRRKGWNAAARNLEDKYIHTLGLAKREDPVSKDMLKPLAMFQRPKSNRYDTLQRTLRGP
jgi:hypothetical protein